MSEYTLDLWPSRTRINLTDPRPEDIHIEDIAWGLSQECRFAGHIPKFYSVAEHCVHAARLGMAMVKVLGGQVALDVACRALLHDAAEGLGWRDLPSPVKKLLADYRMYEKRTQRVVYERFGLAPHKEHDALVKSIDDELYHIEDRYFRHDEQPYGYLTIQCWTPAVARDIYTATFRDLFPKEKA